MPAILGNIQKSVNIQGIDTYKEMGVSHKRKKKGNKIYIYERARKKRNIINERGDSRRRPPRALRRHIFWNGKVTDCYVINFPPARVQLRENQMSQWPRTFRLRVI